VTVFPLISQEQTETLFVSVSYWVITLNVIIIIIIMFVKG